MRRNRSRPKSGHTCLWAVQAIPSGELPLKAGMILVRHGEQYELTFQAETFAVSGAKIQIDDDAERRGILEDCSEGLRGRSKHCANDALARAGPAIWSRCGPG